MRNNDTALIRMVIENLAKRHNWDYGYAIEKFYNSKICHGLSNEKTGMFTFSPNEIVTLVEQDLNI